MPSLKDENGHACMPNDLQLVSAGQVIDINDLDDDQIQVKVEVAL